MVYKCPGCHKTFSLSRGLSGHTPTCQPYKNKRRTGLRRQENANEDSNIPPSNDNTIESSQNEAGPSNIPSLPIAPAIELQSDKAVSLIFWFKLSCFTEYCFCYNQSIFPDSTSSTRYPKRTKQLPKRYHQTPSPASIAPQSPEPPISIPQSPNISVAEDNVPEFTTEPNYYGVYRSYKWTNPSFIPDEPTPDSNILPSSIPNITIPATSHHPDPSAKSKLSTTKELLMGWLYNGCNTKSFTDLNNLVHNVLLNPTFHLEDLTGFDAAKEARNLDQYRQSPRSVLGSEDGWIETSVPITLPPVDRGSHGPESNALQYDVQGLFYRKPLEVIKAAFMEDSATQFHLSPFEDFLTYIKYLTNSRLQLDDAIQDFYTKEFGKPATAEVLTHLRRELMQAIWQLMLDDDDFMDAYVNGIVIMFPDGIKRRLFLRIFIYSADYPEKVLLACIKSLGTHPCPRCLVKKCDIHKLGSKRDLQQREKHARIDSEYQRFDIEQARKWIYSKGIKINSTAINNLLASKSLTPTRNAFSNKLEPHGFNFYDMFCPDLMHEFELGVWKMTFTHLIRLLYAQGGDGIQALNQRYRQISTFGRDTIRKFNNNVSGMKKLAARDFEDLLQTTIRDLESSTIRLGSNLRLFSSAVCDKFLTTELPSEEAARGRRKQALAIKRAKAGISPADISKGKGKDPEGERRQRKFNMATYKLHALGDYPSYIRLFGTTDNFTTQTGELEHRRVKRFYPRSHKGKFTIGIAKHTRRERILHNLGTYQKRPAKRRRLNNKRMSNANGIIIPFNEVEKMPTHSPYDHYEMSHETRHALTLSTWLGDNSDDPALTGFLDSLQDHLLGRILHRGKEWEGDDVPFTDAERATVRIVGGRIYRHKVIRINYTTYDMQRDQDSLNPRTHANIMLMSRDDSEHPYWYARIIGIFHAVVQHSSMAESATMDFLWVRWYGADPTQQSRSGWKARRLPRIGFVRHEVDEETGLSPSFGFVDPAHVIRGVHLVPAFNHGSTLDDLPPSIHARLPHEGDYDYNFYYINYFVDRDMFMRYRGGGVGHHSTRNATDSFRQDRHHSDFDKARKGVASDGVCSDEESGSSDEESESSDEGSSSDEEPLPDQNIQPEMDEELEEEEEYSDGPLEWPESDDEREELEEVADDDLGPEDGLGEGDEEDDLGFAEY
ncbi:hypothetical protein BJ912DRAFT_901526 [Pholiota molesta]|nr:hypothetical protein BJ912DRAFT_901526 [Pholiota molesta]